MIYLVIHCPHGYDATAITERGTVPPLAQSLMIVERRGNEIPPFCLFTSPLPRWP